MKDSSTAQPHVSPIVLLTAAKRPNGYNNRPLQPLRSLNGLAWMRWAAVVSLNLETFSDFLIIKSPNSAEFAIDVMNGIDLDKNLRRPIKNDLMI